MQTIVVTLLFHDGKAPGPVMEVAPWIDARFVPQAEILARLDEQTHRRSIKTHTPADGIPWYPTASYIVVARDGRDACMSFMNHMAHMRQDVIMDLAGTLEADGIEFGAEGIPPTEDPHAFFQYFLANPMWFEHVASFWAHRGEPNVLFVHFDDMKADLEAQMRRVANFLEIDVAHARWPALVDSCTFESMKARSAEIADFDSHFVGGADTFLYKGTNGRWRDILTPEELDAFDQRSAELLSPDAIDWLTNADARRA
jgi:aryl sulfotransferase